MAEIVWTKAPRYLRDFNGLRKSVRAGHKEVGIFGEKHPIAGCRWSVRVRPLGPDGKPTDSWGYGLPRSTMREAVISAEEMAEEETAKGKINFGEPEWCARHLRPDWCHQEEKDAGI